LACFRRNLVTLPHLTLLLLLFWGQLYSRRFKSALGEIKLGKILLQVNTHRLTETLTRRNTFKKATVTSARRSLLLTLCKSVRQLPTNPPSACDVICSLYVLKFLIVGIEFYCAILCIVWRDKNISTPRTKIMAIVAGHVLLLITNKWRNFAGVYDDITV